MAVFRGRVGVLHLSSLRTSRAGEVACNLRFAGQWKRSGRGECRPPATVRLSCRRARRGWPLDPVRRRKTKPLPCRRSPSRPPLALSGPAGRSCRVQMASAMWTQRGRSFVSWSGLSRELSVSCRKVMAFGLTAPCPFVAARARTGARLAHVYAYGREGGGQQRLRMRRPGAPGRRRRGQEPTDRTLPFRPETCPCQSAATLTQAPPASPLTAPADTSQGGHSR